MARLGRAQPFKRIIYGIPPGAFAPSISANAQAATGTGSAFNATVTVAPNAESTAGTGAAFNASAIMANAVSIVITAQNIVQPILPTPGVILGPSPGVVETVRTFFVITALPVPPCVQTVGVIPGRSPPLFAAAPTSISSQSSAVLQPPTSVQVIRGLDHGRVETVPVPDIVQIQDANIPYPLQAVMVYRSYAPVSAIGFTAKDTRANNGGNASFSTAAITIGNGNLALISISQAISTTGVHPVRPSLPSGSGITNVAFVAEIITFDPGGNDNRSLHLFSAIGNGTSAIVSYSFPTAPSNSNCGIDEVTGGQTVVQQSSTASGTGGTLTGTSLAALQSGSATFACFACNDGQTSTMTPRSGWTELHDDLGATAITISLERQYKVVGDTASSATLDSQIGTPRWGVIAVEIAVGASVSAGVASGTGSAGAPGPSVAPNAGNAAGSGAAFDATTLRANAVSVVLATPPPPPPATSVQVVSGWNPSRVETVPVPGLVQAQAIQQPLAPVRVYPSAFTSTSGSANAGVASGTGTAYDATISIVEYFATGPASGTGTAYDASTITASAVRVTVQAPLIPPPPVTVKAIPGLNPSSFLTAPVVVRSQASNVPLSPQAVQVVPGWNPSTIETVPVPTVTQVQAIPLPPQRVFVGSGVARSAVSATAGVATGTGAAYDATCITASAVFIVIAAPVIPSPLVTVRVVSGLPTSSVETVPVPRTVQADAIRQSAQTVQVIRGTTPSAVSANAGVATGTGSAYDAAASVSGSSGTATSSGAAGAPSASDAPNAGNASGTGTAYNGSTLTANAEFVLITAPVIPPPPISVKVLSVVIPNVSVTAGLAAGSGTSNNANANIQPNASAASGTGQAYNATATTANAVFITVSAPVIPPPPISVKVVPAFDPSRVETVPVPNLITVQAIRTPTQPVRALSTLIPPGGVAPAGIAAGTGTAYAATPSIAPNAGVATGTGTANNATGVTASAAFILVKAPLVSLAVAAVKVISVVVPSSVASAGAATGSGTANNAKASVAASAGLAAGTGQANDATVSTSSNASAASGTGAANNTKINVGASGNSAAATGSANGIATSISGTSGTASGSGVSGNPTPADAANAINASASGAAAAGDPNVSVNAGVATGTGAAYDATTIRQSTLILIKSPTRVTVKASRTSVTVTSAGSTPETRVTVKASRTSVTLTSAGLTHAETSNSGANSAVIAVNGQTTF